MRLRPISCLLALFGPALLGQAPTDLIDRAARLATQAREYYHGPRDRLADLVEPCRTLAKRLPDLARGDRDTFAQVVFHWLDASGCVLEAPSERASVLEELDRVLLTTGDPRARAFILQQLTRLAFDRHQAGTLTERWVALMAQQPPGPRNAWVVATAARALINLCGAPRIAEQVLSEALDELENQPKWSEATSRALCRDIDIWVTMPERPAAGSWDDALGHLLLLRGFARLRLGRTLAAVADMVAAREPLQRTSNVHRIANVDHNMAFAWLDLGDCKRALDVARRTEEAYRAPPWHDGSGTDHNGVQAMRSVQARALLERDEAGDRRAAITLLEAVLAEMPDPSRNETNGQSMFILIAALLDEPATSATGDELDRLLREASAVASQSRLAAAEHDVLVARRNLQLDRPDLAERAAHNALTRLRGENQPHLFVAAQLVQGEIARRQRRFDASLDALQSAADELRRYIVDQQLWHLHGSVRAFVRRFDEVLEAAVLTVRERADGGVPRLQDLRALHRLLQQFHGFESWCWALHAKGDAMPDKAEHRDMLQVQQERRSQLLAERQRLLAETPADPRSFLARRRKLEATHLEIDRLGASIADLHRQSSPRLALVTRDPPKLEEVQAQLTEGEVLVECFLLAGETLALVTTPSAVALQQLPRGARWHTTIERWRDWKRNPDVETDPTRIEPLRELSAQLLPADGWLATMLREAGTRRLLWSPAGALCEVPMAALELDGQPLCQSLAVAHVLSGSVLAQRRSSGPRSLDRRQLRLLALGNPRYPDEVVDRYALRGMAPGGGFPSLPATSREVLAIARMFAQEQERARLRIESPESFNGELVGDRFRLLLGTEAHKRALDAKALGIASVLHIACHGYSDPVAPARSFLALTLSDDPGLRETDQMIRLSDLCRMRGDYELLALSACETAASDASTRSQSTNLAWAACLAGARRVLATGWQLSDENARRLVVSFYEHWLERGRPAAVALRVVQRDAIGVVPVRDWAALQLWSSVR